MSDVPTNRPLLEVTVTEGERTVIALVGDLDPHTAPQVHDAIDAVVGTDGVTHVALDLAGIAFIDSSGLRAFVAGREVLAQAGIEMALRNPSANTRRLLDITGLGEIIEVA